MNYPSLKSDIEQILQTQTWKHKKLPPLPRQKHSFKSKSVTELEKPRKIERLSIQPLTVSDSLAPSPQDPSPLFSNQISLSSLAIPFPIISKAILEITSKGPNFDLQVPLFPKREFGNSIKENGLTPKFERMQSLTNVNTTRELKVESGRIKMKENKGIKKRFTFMDHYNHVTSEKAIRRMNTIYVDDN